jgi:hypothetical protein
VLPARVGAALPGTTRGAVGGGRRRDLRVHSLPDLVGGQPVVRPEGVEHKDTDHTGDRAGDQQYREQDPDPVTGRLGGPVSVAVPVHLDRSVIISSGAGATESTRLTDGTCLGAVTMASHACILATRR